MKDMMAHLIKNHLTVNGESGAAVGGTLSANRINAM